MNIPEIVQAIKEGSHSLDLTDSIDLLTHEDRALVRGTLGDIPFPRNLVFDYKQQVWLI